MSNLLDTLDIMVTVGDMDYKKLDIMGMMERMDTLYTGIHWNPGYWDTLYVLDTLDTKNTLDTLDTLCTRNTADTLAQLDTKKI